MRRLIGITGGIGTGKSTVTAYLHHHHHLPILDADLYARAAVEPGTPILAEITQHYGDRILLPDGRLDRAQLGGIIFTIPSAKAWLEARIHPYVRERFTEDIAHLPLDAVAGLAIPLLFEAAMTDLVTEIWVVSCDRSTQIQRVMLRDALDRSTALTRIDSQMPLAAKIARANVVLNNDRTLLELYSQIDLAIRS
jgi:dephospho-CoA kinase